MIAATFVPYIYRVQYSYISRFDIRAKSLPIYGDENNNHINGTDEADIIDGGTGDDTLCGFDGEEE